MGIFDSITDAIFGKAHAAPVEPPVAEPVTKTASAESAGTSGTPAPVDTAAVDTAAVTGTVDVAAVLNAAVAAKKQKLNWRTSIVDLMKALDLDSSLDARKKLAEELNYTGDTNDSAKMNVWLHKALMTKLAANGGKVPADLTS